MYTRKLIDFFHPRTAQQTEPLPGTGITVDAEFDWPPSAEDLEAYGVVRVSADDGSEILSVGGNATAGRPPRRTSRASSMAGDRRMERGAETNSAQ